MKIYQRLGIIAIQAAALCVARPAKSATLSTFYPAPESTNTRFEPKPGTDDIQILTYIPAEPVVILGEVNIASASNASLHELMVAALNEAKARGGDFVALAPPSVYPSMFLGKMVPAGHGRSIFVPGPLQGSEVGRIAAIPAKKLGSLRLIIGRYTRIAS
jgi:hypothetical protein